MVKLRKVSGILGAGYGRGFATTTLEPLDPKVELEIIREIDECWIKGGLWQQANAPHAGRRDAPNRERGQVEADLHDRDIRILCEIHDHPGESVTGISCGADVPMTGQTGTSKRLKKLISHGLAENRNRKHYLTPSGKAVVEAHRAKQ